MEYVYIIKNKEDLILGIEVKEFVFSFLIVSMI
jgi:hypothetical protein